MQRNSAYHKSHESLANLEFLLRHDQTAQSRSICRLTVGTGTAQHMIHHTKRVDLDTEITWEALGKVSIKIFAIKNK